MHRAEDTLASERSRGPGMDALGAGGRWRRSGILSLEAGGVLSSLYPGGKTHEMG